VRPSTTYDHLEILPSGEVERGFRWTSSELDRLSNLLEVLSSSFALVVLDMPPVATGFDALPLLSRGGHVAVVVQTERVPGHVARQTVQRLRQSRIPLLGTIANRRVDYFADRLPHTPSWET
jgi:Mrp family chromosome partitioning ATPase